MTSFTEGISLTLLEAMNFELPVIATNTGGNPEVIDNGKSGFLVELNDDYGMANLLLKLKSAPDLRRQLGFQGKKIATEKFAFDKMMCQYLQLYSK
jgi:glycosyltransferase involved in cell wall biosynthesis